MVAIHAWLIEHFEDFTGESQVVFDPPPNRAHFDDVVKIDYYSDLGFFGPQPVKGDPLTHTSRKPVFSGNLNARIEKIQN